MRYVLLVGYLLLVLIVSTISAQDTTATLRVLNPEDVFVDDVEIIEVLVEINIDEINRVLYHLAADSETWELLALPDELSGYVLTERLPNGNFRVFEVPHDTLNTTPNIAHTCCAT